MVATLGLWQVKSGGLLSLPKPPDTQRLDQVPNSKSGRMKMSDISIGTLMMSIQAVKKEIAWIEHLLTSETLRDDADIQDLLFSYDEAGSELKNLYIEKSL